MQESEGTEAPVPEELVEEAAHDEDPIPASPESAEGAHPTLLGSLPDFPHLIRKLARSYLDARRQDYSATALAAAAQAGSCFFSRERELLTELLKRERLGSAVDSVPKSGVLVMQESEGTEAPVPEELVEEATHDEDPVPESAGSTPESQGIQPGA